MARIEGTLSNLAVGIGLTIGGLLSVPLMWDSYFWLFLTGGLAVLGVIVALWTSSRQAFVASIIAWVTLFVVVLSIIQVEILEVAPTIWGSGGI